VDDADRPITVYWRPGCGFCAALLRDLEARGVPHERRDIWQDPEAAAFVRGHNRGDELVPTVDVAGTVLSNPTADQVLAAASS
jgi:mycoredoxin